MTVAAIAAAALLALLVVDGTRWVELRVTDSVLLVRGSHVASDCIQQGIWSGCRMPAGGSAGAVGAWPILQYLLAIPLVSLGVPDFSVLTVMALVSSLAAGGVLLLIALPIRQLFGTEWAVVLAVGMLTGPFLLYAFLPLGEALAAFLALAFVVAACARRPGWLLITGFLAGLTKETVAPFLLVLAVVCARDARDRWLPARRLLVPIVVGLGGAVVINSAFNVFRFGTIRNLEYTEPQTRVPGIRLPIRLALADWFAPNVGVVWFWSVAGLMVAGLVVSTVVLMVRHRRTPAHWLPALTVAGVVAAFTGGLSLWYSTFGWVAWGPRLTIPLLPAFMVAALRTAGAPMTAGLRWLFATAPRALLVGGVVALLGAAQVGVVWHPQAIELPLVVDASCPQIVPIEEATPDYFYGCGLHEAWRMHPLSLWQGLRHGPAAQTVAEVFEIGMVAGAATWLHRRNRRRVRQAAGARPFET